MPAQIVQANTAGDFDAARALFQEYAAGLPFSLCFQGFDAELASLPGKYAPPSGRLLLARDGGATVGCIALRALEPGVCEMKRLYVRPSHRGTGLGRRLCESLLSEARAIGYRQMKLDTEPDMAAATRLYQSLGFQPIDRYNDDPRLETVYLGLDLAPAKAR